MTRCPSASARTPGATMRGSSSWPSRRSPPTARTPRWSRSPASPGSARPPCAAPTRRALLEAVSHRRIDALCERARELAGKDDSRAALLEWLGDLLAYCVTARGLANVLTYDAETEAAHQNACSVRMEEAGGPLLRRAVEDGAVSGEVTVADLVTLVVGIALATEHHPDPRGAAERLFALAVAGLSPQR